MFKSALPLALATSPLLLAAAQPPVLESIGPDCSLLTNGWEPNAQDSLVMNAVNPRPATAQPISFGNQALVTSQDELSVFVDDNEGASFANGWGTALRLLLDNPYLTGQRLDEQRASQSADALLLTSENRCISSNKSAGEALRPLSQPSGESLSTVDISTENISTKAISAQSISAKTLVASSSPIRLLSQAPDTGDEPAEPDASAATDDTDVDASEGPAPLPQLDMQTAPDGRTPVQSVEPVEPSSSADEPTPANDNSVPSLRMPAPAGVVPEQAPVPNPNNFTPTGESPTPFDGTVATTLESLPDGNYRYLAGNAESRAYTTEELSQRGGSVFVLNKTNGVVTGDLLPRIGLPGICVTGRASGNTLTGAAYPYDTTDSLQDSAREIGETFEPHGSGALQIRRTRTENGGLYYADAQLDVSEFTLINAGVSVPPTSCTVGPTGGRDQS